MRYIEEVELGGKSRYYNLNLFGCIYIEKSNRQGIDTDDDKDTYIVNTKTKYIVVIRMSFEKCIRVNITPVSLERAKYLQHKFLELLKNNDVKIISINSLNGGKIYEEVCFE